MAYLRGSLHGAISVVLFGGGGVSGEPCFAGRPLLVPSVGTICYPKYSTIPCHPASALKVADV
jgi:hypothetical protein